MVLVHVSTDTLTLMNEWRDQPELEFNLNPRKHQIYHTMFYGFWWTLFYRVLLPIIAFATSFEAASELYRLHSTAPNSRVAEANRNVAFVVCCIEAPCMLLLGMYSGSTWKVSGRNIRTSSGGQSLRA